MILELFLFFFENEKERERGSNLRRQLFLILKKCTKKKYSAFFNVYGILMTWLHFMFYYYPGQKKNHHRDSRREERCSTYDIMLNQARSAQG